MKFQLTAASLNRELEFLKTVSRKNATIPVLQNVLIEPHPSFVRLATTDLETSCESMVQADTEAGESISVNTHILARIVRQCGENDILVFSTSKSSLQISSRNAHYEIPALPPGDFPSEDNNLPQTRIPASIFLRLIGGTIRTITKDTSRYALNSTLMESWEDTLRMVATDGHRLAVASERADLSVPRFLISRRTLKALLVMLEDNTDDVLFSQNEQYTFFRSGDRLITSLIPSGKFPEWQKVIPNNERVAIVNAYKLLAALDRIKIYTTAAFKAASLLFEGNVVTLSAGNVESGGAVKVTIPLVSSNHKLNALNIAFNIKYLKDILVGVSGDLRIELPEDNSNPALFQSVDRPTYKTVLMPVCLL